MAFLFRKHFKSDLRELFGMQEADETPAPENDVADDLEKDVNAQVDAGSEPDVSAAPAETTPEDGQTETPAEEPQVPAEPEVPEPETVPGTGDQVTAGAATETDDGKIQTMFTDTGVPQSDYALTNPNNIRFAKFRFKKAGIDINQMMNEVEQKTGLTSDKLIFRLTPDQYESYKDKGKELRSKYDLIEKREKNVVMFNSKIPIYNLNKETGKMEKIDDGNPNLLKNAFSKIDEFLVKRFGDNWVDDMNAIDFVQSIKVNFADKESISPNMLTVKFFESDEEKLIPFNKLYVKIPKSVEDFVRENKDNQNYLRSAVYRTLAAGYLDGSTDSNGVFPIVKNDDASGAANQEDANTGAENAETPEETGDEEPDITGDMGLEGGPEDTEQAVEPEVGGEETPGEAV